MQLHIRRATGDDAEILGRFGAALARQHVEYDSARFVFPGDRLEDTFAAALVAQLANQEAFVFIAEDAAVASTETSLPRLIGYAFARVESPDMFSALPRCGALHDVYIVPEARGARVGEALVRAAVAALRTADVSLVLLSTARQNEAAQRLFARCGFSVTMHEMAMTIPPA